MATENPDIQALRTDWTILYMNTLPSLARAKHPAQYKWPVHLDHCFARIILDAVIGIDAPWTSKMERPAMQNASAEQLQKCIALGRSIAIGTADLVELNERSLGFRGKIRTPGRGKRKSGDGVKEVGEDEIKIENKRMKMGQQMDIRIAMSGKQAPATVEDGKPPKSEPDVPPCNPSDERLISIIKRSALTPFRQRVLIALLQVPHGHYTTYLALSNFLNSCPRAVGNAMRNNPFAPEVPCHRVVASDGGLGGFGGEWGEGGKREEKVKLLRGEGVRIHVQKGKVLGKVWSAFV